ncbi:MAG: DUF6883 domain-containing protein [Thermodesulfobacteriota bacterium]
MKIPSAEHAYIPSAKLRDYLLSSTHPVGKWKAKVFQRYGFHAGNVEVLKSGLLVIGTSQDIKETIQSRYGLKYVVDGSLQSPLGEALNVRTIWIVDTGKRAPRFVTVYPI